MREIIFKAKRKDNGEWVEGLLWKKKYDSNKIFISCFPDKDDNEEVFVVEPDTICQYTGLTDKNGRKIWENDIVVIPVENGYFLVEWSDTEARWQMNNEEDAFIVDFDNYWSYQVEVIGNVFDNSELLEKAR